ncbi:MAG TPA: hypothetical protein VF026_23985 [Ktedonobacteraceae bacterium]
MFEATFKITALLESNEQGQRVFQIVKNEAPVDDAGLLSLVTMIYQQDVSHMLRAGDELNVTVRLDFPPREIENTLRFREDGRFEGEGVAEPTAELLPLIATMSERFRQLVQPGDVITFSFQVQRH